MRPKEESAKERRREYGSVFQKHRGTNVRHGSRSKIRCRCEKCLTLYTHVGERLDKINGS